MSATDRQSVTQRLVKLAQERCGVQHGWQTEFARSLGMTLQAIQPYLTGIYLPGRKVQERLRSAGYDVEYINVGIHSGGTMQVREQSAAYQPNPNVLRLEAENKRLREELQLVRSFLSKRALKLLDQSKGGK